MYHTLTFQFCKNLEECLGIPYEELPSISDQKLNEIPGDATTGQLGFGGFKHTEESKLKMKGRIPWNKGVSNLGQREKMLINNPMKKSHIVQQVAKSLRGRIAWNRGPNYMPPKPVRFGPNGRKITKWIFQNGDIIISYHTRKTCESLGLSFSSIRHKIDNRPYVNGKYKGLEIKRI